MKGTLYYDHKSGKLVKGYLWSLNNDRPPSQPDDKEFMYAEVVEGTDGKPDFKEIKDCPVNPQHVTGFRHLKLNVELYGNVLPDFVYATGGDLIISDNFAIRLKESKLTGYQITDIIDVVRNKDSLDGHKLYALEMGSTATNNPFNGPRWRIRNTPNVCPHCRKEPIICPGCDVINRKCPECNQWTLLVPTAPHRSHPDGLRIERPPVDMPSIVEGKNWNGSDWFMAVGNYMVSNRAKVWMEQTHTFPVTFKPALLNIEGCEERFKDLLPKVEKKP